MTVLRSLLAITALGVAASVGGCDVPARPVTQGDAARSTAIAAKAPSARHRKCEFDTGSRICRYADDGDGHVSDSLISLQRISTGTKAGGL